ncbi:hypothetical protein EFW17_20185 [Halostreptopolyspora alba]|uniref:Uncharacterized protein n=1 Tax=Halostreptopolyspora alba TaxID=2487137 RepID=A0A3N0E2R3_9ACTN|nr:hypothetical protein EFW17_20185 [Nocardiopsaceae bacterium YIM 96095]
MLAASVTRALNSPDHPFPLARRVAEIGDDGGGPGAVRVVGADVLAPYLLGDRVPGHDDIEAVRAAVREFPAPPPAPHPDPVWAARDWALVRALAVLGVDATEWEGVCAEAGDGSADPGATGSEPWPTWAVGMARLSTLALPHLEGATRTQALARRTDLARGMARAMLRRDHHTAARLARWLALDQRSAPEPLLGSALDHLALLGVDESRTALEIALARRIAQPEH